MIAGLSGWRPTALAGGAVVLAGASWWLYAHRTTGDEIAWLGLGVIWLSLLPVAVYLLQRHPPAVPFLPAAGLYYLVFFGLPVFTIPLVAAPGKPIVLYDHVSLVGLRAGTVTLVLAGIALLFAAFYVGRHALFSRVPAFRLPRVPSPPSLAVLYFLLLAVHLAYAYLPTLRALPSLGQFAGPAGYVAWGGFFLLWRRGQLPVALAAALLVFLLPLELYARARFLLITDLILFVAFFVFLFFRERLYAAMIVGMAVVLLVVATYGVTAVVRPSIDAGFSRFAYTYRGLVALFFEGSETMAGRHNPILRFHGKFGSLAHRTGHLWIFQYVDDHSPEPIPYWGGESYKPLPTTFIPRLIYPSKPKEAAGGAFGKRYHFLWPNSQSSLNIPWIIELLANFGPPGVLVGMTVFGALLGFLDRVFNRREMSDPAFVIGLTVLFPLFYQESNFSEMTGSLIPLVVALFLYFWLGSKVLSSASRAFR